MNRIVGRTMNKAGRKDRNAVMMDDGFLGFFQQFRCQIGGGGGGGGGGGVLGSVHCVICGKN